MTEATAVWNWQSLDSARSLTHVAPEHLARIRRLAVQWDSAESGAAGLVDEDFLELDEAMSEADFQAALEVFMTSADMAAFAGTITNPYARAGADKAALLEDTPDPAVAAQLLSGQAIELTASAEESALWAAANLGANGINPKRPFGSENVSRDVRAIVDPDKTLSNAAFAKRRKHLESRLLLLLQFYVQNARLEPGVYHRGGDWRWRKVDPDAPAPGEPLTRQEWQQRMSRQMHYECGNYSQTLRCLIHLVWNNRLSGSYAALTQQFKLDNLFDGTECAEYEGRVEERLRVALMHFPDRKGTMPRPWFALTLARMLNGQARFAQAREVLEQADLYGIAPDEADLSTIDTIGVAFLEGLVTRRGLDAFDEDEFQSILAGCHSRWRTRADLWRFVWNVQHEPERYEDTAQSLGLAHAQALAAQIELMRGGYVPDYQVKHF
ncbi:hypothetical protein [Lysobacter sp. CA199]|uniref:hypothetical protein n=1 Tax=Lysobacter sp. CA199 TaxID=3455608 RepID=UPI003F8D5330